MIILRQNKEEKVYKAASLSIIPCATLIYKYQPGNEVD